MSHARQSTVDRGAVLRQALRVSRALCSRPGTLGDLADRLGIHARTVRRYIYALRDAGIDVNTRHDGRGLVYALDARAWAGLMFLPED